MKVCLNILTTLLLLITSVSAETSLSAEYLKTNRGSITVEAKSSYNEISLKRTIISKKTDCLAPESIFSEQVKSLTKLQKAPLYKRILKFTIKAVFKGVKYGLLSSTGIFLIFLFVPLINITASYNFNLLNKTNNPLSAKYETNFSYYLNQHQTISNENLHLFLDAHTQKIKEIFPEYSENMLLAESLGYLTYDGLRTFGAYFLLLEQGEVSELPFDIYQYLNTQEAMKIKIWTKNFKQRPTASITNDKRIEELERIPGQSSFYRTVERMAEGSQYTSRFRNYETFANYVQNEIGVSADDVFNSFNNYFEIIWQNNLSKKEEYSEGDKEMLRDLMLLQNIYHFLHRMDYQDSYLLEGFTNARQFVELRHMIGKVKDGSLGAFQGYDSGLATILADTPELADTLAASTDQDIKELGRRWQGKNRDEIYNDLKSGDFLYGATSPVYFYWKISMIAQCQAVLNYNKDVMKILKDTDINDPNLRFTFNMVLRKSKVREISDYLRKDFVKDIISSNSGEWIRIPATRTHMYLEVLEMLKAEGKISTEREFLFYYQLPEKHTLNIQELNPIQTTESAA